MLRQYWPKGTDLSTLTDEQISEVETSQKLHTRFSRVSHI